MPVLAQMLLDCTVTLAPLAEMLLDARIEEPGGGYDPERVLLLDGEVDTTLTEAARPRANRRQIAHLRLLVDGAVINPGDLLPSISVDLQLGAAGGWSCSFPTRERWEYSSPFGGFSEDFYGPPPGKLPVDVEAVYLTPSGPRVVRLITNGVAHSAEEQDGPECVDSIQGGDALLRHDQGLLTLVLPPGHGLTRGDILRRGLARLGLTNTALVPGGRCYKEIQWLDTPGIPALQEFIGIESRALQLDPWAVAENPRTILDPGRRVDWTFTHSDLLLRGGMRKSAAGDGPTRVTLTGTKQITRESCARRTEVEEVFQVGPHTPATAAFRQAFDGVLTAYTPPAPPELDPDAIITRTQVTTEYDCDTVVSVRVREWGWMNPRVWRYTLNGATTTYGFNPTAYNPNAYLYEAGAVADDGAEAFLWPQERFVETSDTLTTYQFDAAGYKTGGLVTKHGWVLPLWHVKESTSPGAAAWDAVDWQPVRVLGGGDAVGNNAIEPGGGFEYWTGGPGLVWMEPYAETTTQSYQNTALGQKQSETETAYRILAYEGGRDGAGFVHLYNGNTEKDARKETRRVAEVLTRKWLPGSTETTHHEITSRRDSKGVRIVPDEIGRDLPSHLPAAERRSDILPPASTYESDAEAAFALAASRFDSQAIKASVAFPALIAFREEWELKQGEPWAESTAELEAKAIDTGRELSAQRVSYELPLNALIRPGQVASIPFRRRALVHLIDRVNHGQNATEATTRVEGKVYVI